MLVKFKVDERLQMSQVVEYLQEGYMAPCKHLSPKFGSTAVGAAGSADFETVGGVSHVEMP